MTKKTFAVIGLGSFGSRVSKELFDLGQDIICIDKDEDAVIRMSQYINHCVVCDAKDEKAMREVGLDSVDHAIVCVSEFDQTMILATMILKDLGVKKVTVKVKDSAQERIMQKIGADEIIFPEKIIARKLAHKISAEHILDIIEIDNELSYVEFQAPKQFIGKSLNEIDFRKRYKLTVVAIRREGLLKLPKIDEGFIEGDILLIIGHNTLIEKFDELIEKNKIL